MPALRRHLNVTFRTLTIFVGWQVSLQASEHKSRRHVQKDCATCALGALRCSRWVPSPVCSASVLSALTQRPHSALCCAQHGAKFFVSTESLL